MDLVQIKYFLALSRTLNFTRAAELCHVTQPALTKSIQRLEDEMGGPLILRERNLTQLTELGSRLLPALQQTYESAEAARRMAVEFRKQDNAPLRLGIGPDVGSSALLPVISELDRRLPGFELTVQTGGDAEITDWLLQSQVDIAVTAEDDSLPERANRWRLFDDPVVVVLPRGHPLDDAAPIDAAALHQHAGVGPVSPDTPLGRLRRRLCIGETILRHRGSNERIISELIFAGLGVGLSTERHHVPAGITRRPLNPPLCLTVSVAVMAGRPMSRAAEIFLKLARARSWEAVGA